MAAPEIREIVRLLQSGNSGYYFFAKFYLFLLPRLPCQRRRGLFFLDPVVDDSFAGLSPR
jgi:hypothetical protein